MELFITVQYSTVQGNKKWKQKNGDLFAHLPVDNLPNGLHIVGAQVLVLKVIRVLQKFSARRL